MDNAQKADLAAQFRPSGPYGRRDDMSRACAAAVLIHNGATDPGAILREVAPGDDVAATPAKRRRIKGVPEGARIIVED